MGSAHDGTVRAFIGDRDPEGTGEGIAADAAGNLYGALTGGPPLKKYIPAWE
jgi:hypothetical protein